GSRRSEHPRSGPCSPRGDLIGRGGDETSVRSATFSARHSSSTAAAAIQARLFSAVGCLTQQYQAALAVVASRFRSASTSLRVLRGLPSAMSFICTLQFRAAPLVHRGCSSCEGKIGPLCTSVHAGVSAHPGGGVGCSDGAGCPRIGSGL